MTDPLVSVKMITYNHAPYIAQAIEGVLNQKINFPIELVIGEDCSTDGTREIVFDYQKKYPDIIRVITSDKNVGMRKNGYRTTKACRGKYIAFCEGDDYWHNPNKLQRQINFLESHSDCGMVFGDCDVHHNRSGKFKKNVRYSDGYQTAIKIGIEQIFGDEDINRWPWTLTAVIRKCLYNEIIENDPYLHKSEKFLMGDAQLFAELSLISVVWYIPECLATYRVVDESASNSKDRRKRLQFWISHSEMELYLCEKHKLSEHIRKRAESIWCEKSLYLAFLDRNAKLAMEVKRKKKTFTWKEWLRYLGARYLLIHRGYRAALLFKNLLRKPDDGLFGN